MLKKTVWFQLLLLAYLISTARVCSWQQHLKVAWSHVCIKKLGSLLPHLMCGEHIADKWTACYEWFQACPRIPCDSNMESPSWLIWFVFKSRLEIMTHSQRHKTGPTVTNRSNRAWHPYTPDAICGVMCESFQLPWQIKMAPDCFGKLRLKQTIITLDKCKPCSSKWHDFCLPGAQFGLVPTDAGHVLGQQRRGRRAERDQKPAGEAGVHHETGVQPVRPADWAQRTGWLNWDETPTETSLGKHEERVF